MQQYNNECVIYLLCSATYSASAPFLTSGWNGGMLTGNEWVWGDGSIISNTNWDSTPPSIGSIKLLSSGKWTTDSPSSVNYICQSAGELYKYTYQFFCLYCKITYFYFNVTTANKS